jgi:hypothetical protein
MDNVFLKTELKATTDEIEVNKARWKYGLVLMGLALLHEEAQSKKSNDQDDSDSSDEAIGENVEVRIERFTKALAPVLMPMINTLGAMDLEGAIAMNASGEDT